MTLGVSQAKPHSLGMLWEAGVFSPVTVQPARAPVPCCLPGVPPASSEPLQWAAVRTQPRSGDCPST